METACEWIIKWKKIYTVARAKCINQKFCFCNFHQQIFIYVCIFKFLITDVENFVVILEGTLHELFNVFIYISKLNYGCQNTLWLRHNVI